MRTDTYLKCNEIIQEAIKDILLKHFDGLPNPRIEDGRLKLDNPSMKNGIKYNDMEDYYPADWRELQQLIFKKEEEKDSTDMFVRLEYAWSSPEVKESLDKLLTKIENDNRN